MLFIAKYAAVLGVSTMALLSPNVQHETALNDVTGKSDLPSITAEQLAFGADANPYPESYVSDILYVEDAEDCDETGVAYPTAEFVEPTVSNAKMKVSL